jgi:hypothetical protein
LTTGYGIDQEKTMSRLEHDMIGVPKIFCRGAFSWPNEK